MNRPLFFIVIVFALGEVLYMIADKSTRGGILLGMLLCCAFFIVKMKKYKICWLLCGIMLVLGYARAGYFFLHPAMSQLYSFEKGSWETINQENYSIKFCPDYSGEEKYLKGEGMIVDVSSAENGVNLIVDVHGGYLGNTTINKKFKLILYGINCDDGEFHIGGKVSVLGNVCGFDKATNPGSFDMRNYYLAKNIFGYTYEDDVDIVKLEAGKNIYYKYKDWLRDLREKLSDRLYTLVEVEYGALFDGILLGNKDNIGEDINLLYRVNGISHILAISGLHISLIGMSIYKIFRRLRLGFLSAGILSFIFIFSYGVMTGMSFATMRAVVMFVVYLGSQITGRRNDMLTSLSVALIIIVCGSPYRLLDKGIWLSFGAMFGVYTSTYIINIIFSGKKMKKLKSKKKIKLRKLISSIVMSFGVNIITMPIVAVTYYQIPLYSPIINLLVLPLMTIVAVCGIGGILVSYINVWLGAVILLPGKIVFIIYEALCNIFNGLPGSLLNIGRVSLVEVMIYYMTVALLLFLINHKVRILVREFWYKKTKIWLEYKLLFRVSIVGCILCVLIGVNGIILVRILSVRE